MREALRLSERNSRKNWKDGYNFLAKARSHIYNVKVFILGGQYMNSKTKKIVSVVSVVLLLMLCFAGCMPAATTTADGTAAGGTSSTVSFIVSMVVLFAVFYFFMIRPEKKRKKKVEDMRSSLSTGDKIVTIGGIMGNIVSIGEDTITFETGEDRVRLQVAKWAISRKTK